MTNDLILIDNERKNVLIMCINDLQFHFVAKDFLEQ